MKKRLLKIEFPIYIVVFISIAAFILINSPIVQFAFGHDVPLILDGAWRIQNGQVPHNDFSTIIGSAHLFQQYFFLKLFNYNVIAFAASSVALTAIAVAIFVFIFRQPKIYDNSNFVLRAYIFLLLLSIGLGQYSLGSELGTLTYGGLYNRYCFLVLLMLFLNCLYLTNEVNLNVSNLILLLITGVFLNYLLFSKFTYFLAATAIIASLVIFYSFSWKLLAYLLVFSTVAFFVYVMLSGLNLSSFLTDYKIVSSVRTGSLFSIRLIKIKLYHIFDMALMFTCAVFFLQLVYKRTSYKNLIFLAVLGIISIVLHFTNTGERGERDIVFLMALPCLFISTYFSKYFNLLSVKILMLFSLYFIGKNFYSMIAISQQTKVKEEEVGNKYLSGFYVHYANGYCNEEYPKKIMSGVNLLNRNRKQGEKIFTSTFENPFPLLTHTVPPKNDILCWQLGFSFSRSVHPPASFLFKDVDLIIDQKCIDPESSQEIMGIYKKEIGTYFSKIAEDDYWVLYRKVKMVQ